MPRVPVTRPAGLPPLSAMAPSRTEWAEATGDIGTFIVKESEKTLEAYRSQPTLIHEHANLEEDTARGGYARRQLFELIQNGADALAGKGGGSIWIGLTSTHLYCADEGQPIDSGGVRALMFSHLSPKRGTAEIGRFGLGFKSVLGVTDNAEFFSRSGSFRFDRAHASTLIQPIAPDAERYPVLRLPEAIDPWPVMGSDPVLCSLMGWATNIVRLSLKPGTHEYIVHQIRDFPPEFLLFVEHVRQLVLQIDGQEDARTIELRREGSQYTLDNGGNTTRWILIKDIHSLSADAKSDRRDLDDTSEVPISWAAPIARLNDPGYFWAFFPTMTTSLLAGILNAPWKTNEDRQNLLPGVYNDELIDAAAAIVARALPTLSTHEDPAKHLDALPRREESGDSEHSRRLRGKLHSNLQDREIVPDQECKLRKVHEISNPPKDLTSGRQIDSAPFERWAAYDGRPSDWLHHRALTGTRWSTVGRLYPAWVAAGKSIAQWLQALVKDTDPVESSMAAIQTAASIPSNIRQGQHLGDIVLTADRHWRAPDPDSIFWGGGEESNANELVHPQLESDPETLDALKELGVRAVSPESAFRSAASRLLRQLQRFILSSDNQPEMDALWTKFWTLTREAGLPAAAKVIPSLPFWDYKQWLGGVMEWEAEETELHERVFSWHRLLHLRTIAGSWQPFSRTLLPGPIVPDDDSRDGLIAIDVKFHEADLDLLLDLGAVREPAGKYELLPQTRYHFLKRCREEYCRRDDLPHKPRLNRLNFAATTTSGPLEVLEGLSEEGKALYTEALLNLTSTYDNWTMRHDTQNYPAVPFKSPAVEVLREHGRVKTPNGIRKLSAGLGAEPEDSDVLTGLLRHPNTLLIRGAFGLEGQSDATLEPIGEDDPIPLVDIWPGVKPYLASDQANLQLIRCDLIIETGYRRAELDCKVVDGSVYIARRDDEQELRLVLRELGFQLSDEHIGDMLERRTPVDIQGAREKIRACPTDEERLVAAVGEANLRTRLPQNLLTIIERTQGALTGVQVAQAAIATFHTGALREYRHALGRLGPPKQWAGGPQTVAFVRSLGLGEEWAGERNTRRDPYIEVEGPYSLPPLHGYQRKVVGKVRDLMQSDGAASERRGMISMPTGSGKTRVAVQAIVEAIREDGFKGGILWVADRDELCEQAVEGWRQVWSSEGIPATQLRISRMWAGQPPPLPTGQMHVIVASIQTLEKRLNGQHGAYEFLAEFALVVFDEAHRSIAPTSTSVMEKLGLTRWRRAHEPILIGLTATPYRGHDQAETERLVNRYGRKRLDSGAFASDDPEDVIRELQDKHILAQADHATIEGGRFFLYEDELQQSKYTPWLPQSVEDRIAEDTDRTLRIVEAYRDRIDPDWSTLIFATSVEHSRTVAALLTLKGVSARPVSANTDRSSRRRIVEEFRAGRIKALVNFGIFREGFDAPKTRAIIVARPVYSPNLYFQMIGRGLRGTKNGGNDRCLILNVEDNIENFEGKLAFSELDWLWAGFRR